MRKKVNEIQIFTDGASRGNPGHASFGYVILDPSGKLIAEHGEYIGIATNNQAEYRAIVEALREAREHTTGTVNFFMDSELAVRQLTGIYKIRDAAIAQKVAEIIKLSKSFDRITYTHVTRDKNTHADAKANEALDEHFKGLK